MRRPRLAVLALGCVVATASAAIGCAPTYAPGYTAALTRGVAAKNAGRYPEAVKAFEEAANLGARYKDRDEARYLEAEAYEGMEDWPKAEATYGKVVKDSDGRYQGVRAEFARARVEMQHGDIAKGNELMIAAVRRHPSSGLSRHAVRRMSGVIEEAQGPDKALEFLKSFEKDAVGSDLDEEVKYEEGLVLFRAARYEAARDLFIKSAREHPYPKGSLTDDAYYQASLLEEKLGHIDAAIALLVEMMSPMESAYAGSSYERPRWPEAQYRIAKLYRDQKHDLPRARKEFRKMYDIHTASRFVDDALFAEAELESKAGDTREACATMNTLAKAHPDSRYVRCAQELCPSALAAPKPCADYIVRAIHGEGTPLDGNDEPFAPAPLPQESRPTH